MTASNFGKGLFFGVGSDGFERGCGCGGVFEVESLHLGGVELGETGFVLLLRDFAGFLEGVGGELILLLARQLLAFGHGRDELWVGFVLRITEGIESWNGYEAREDQYGGRQGEGTHRRGSGMRELKPVDDCRAGRETQGKCWVLGFWRVTSGIGLIYRLGGCGFGLLDQRFESALNIEASTQQFGGEDAL